MKVLIVASYNKQRFAPFIVEQGEALQKAGITVDYYGVTGKGILGYLKARKGMMQKIRTFQPDIIHAHYGLSGLLANLQRKVPVVTTYHGSDINIPKVLRFSKIAMRLSKWNIFVSQRGMDIALKNLPSNGGIRGGLLPCGVDIENFEPRTKAEARKALGWGDEKKVLFAGAFDNKVKNASLAFEAMEVLEHELHKLNEDYPTFSHSSHPPQAGLDGSVEQLNNETNCLFHPNEFGDNNTNCHAAVELVEMKGFSRDQIANLFYASDAFLMTSFTEGSPQVVKEAMACGCPIVSVDVGDVSERINGVTNCYIAKRTPEDIASKLVQALGAETRTNGRERLLEMGLDNKQVAENLIEIYSNICKY